MTKIYFLFKQPKDVYLAFSGGVDSVVLLDVLINRKHNVTLLTIDHLNTFSQQEVEFCKATAERYNIPYIIKKIKPYDGSTSVESFWSQERNKIFQVMDKPVLTGHHLDDAVAWYVMSAMQGCSKLINYQRGNVLRPMLTVTKENIIDKANEKKLVYITDTSNLDPEYCLRNKVNISLMPHLKECFPGIRTTVRKLILKKEKS